MNNLLKKTTALAVTSVFALCIAITPALANNNTQLSTNDDENSNILMNQQHFGKNLFAIMTGNQEVPGPADPDGIGIAKIKIQQTSGKLCVDMRVFNIDQVTAAHVHHGAKGVAGPVIVTLPTPDANGVTNGCVDVDSNTLKAIRENPSNYYVNVHNASYPGGALRGQLFGF